MGHIIEAWPFLLIIILVLLFFLHLAIGSIVLKIKDYQKIKKGVPFLRQEMLSLRSDFRRIQDLYLTSSLISPEEYAGVPEGSYIDEAGFPRLFGAKSKWEDIYYFHLNYGTGTLHDPRCFHAKCTTPENFYEIKKHCIYSLFYPCSICKPNPPSIAWVDQYKNALMSLEVVDPGITKRHIMALRAKNSTENSILPKSRYTDSELLSYLQACTDAAYREILSGCINPYTNSPFSNEQDYLDYISSYTQLHGTAPILRKYQEQISRIQYIKGAHLRSPHLQVRLFHSNVGNLLKVHYSLF